MSARARKETRVKLKEQSSENREPYGVLGLPRNAHLSSPNNPIIKRIRSLRQRKERTRTGLCFVEGIRLVETALRSRAEVETLVIAPEQLESARGRQLCIGMHRSRPPNLTVSPEVLRSLADREDTQGIGAVVRQRWERLDDIAPAGERGWVALDGIQYPGNLGTILRACDAVDFAGVILIGPTADPYDPIAVRASMGAVFHRRLVRAEFAEFLDWQRRHSLPLIAASPNAPQDYREVRYPAPSLLLLGSEGQGLSPERLAACTEAVHIPMIGQCDSLNVALATGLLLYEAFHQQQGREIAAHRPAG
jgi:TrmH family RNA methyltransferase